MELNDLEESQSFLRGHLEELSEKRKQIPEDVFEVTVFLLEEIIDLYASIAALYKEGHLRSSIILARTILEDAINLRYIYQADSDRRALNYKTFSMREYLKRSEKLKDVPPYGKELFEALRKRAAEYQPSGSRDDHWDGKTLKQKAVEIKSDSAYERYKHMSNYLHSRWQGNRNISDERPYTAFLKDLVFRDVFMDTLHALHAICEKFDLDGGVVALTDYPEPGAVFFYATNPKRQEEVTKSTKH